MLAALAVPAYCPERLGLASHPPDLWVAAVTYAALRARGYRGVGIGVGLGLVRDCLSLDPLGTHAFVLGTVAYLFSEGRYGRAPLLGLPRALFTFLAALLAGWLYVIRLLPMGAEAPSLAESLHAVPTALFTTVAAVLLVYPVLDRTQALDDLLGRRRGLPA